MKSFLLGLLVSLNFAAADIQVFFSPHGGCTEAIVENLGKAKSTVLVQAHSFTSAPIAKALVDAKRRGVNVEVILDKSQRTERYSSADFIQRAGIPRTCRSRTTRLCHNRAIKTRASDASATRQRHPQR